MTSRHLLARLRGSVPSTLAATSAQLHYGSVQFVVPPPVPVNTPRVTENGNVPSVPGFLR